MNNNTFTFFNWAIAFLLFCINSHSVTASESIQQLWKVAERENLGLKGFKQRITAEEFNLKKVKAERLPLIAVQLGTTQLSDQPTMLFSGLGDGSLAVPAGQKRFDLAQATVQQPLYSSGMLQYGIAAQQDILAASQLDWEQQRLRLNKRIAQLYIQINHLDEQVLVAESFYKTAARHRETVTQLYQQGMAVFADKQAGDADFVSAEVHLNTVKKQKSLLIQQMNILLNRPLTQRLTIQPLKSVSIGIGYEAVLQSMVDDNPQIKSLSKRISALNASRKSVAGQEKPQLALVGKYDYSENEYRLEDKIKSMSLVLNWQVDFGRTKHQSNQLIAQRNELRLTRNMLRQSLLVQLNDAVSYFLLNQESAKSLELAAVQSRSYLQNMENKYREGLALQTELYAAKNRAQSRELDFFNAKYEVMRSAIEIAFLTNRFDDLEIELSNEST